MTWEYKIIIGCSLTMWGVDESTHHLNALGKQGWELAATQSNALIFKRKRRAIGYYGEEKEKEENQTQEA